MNNTKRDEKHNKPYDPQPEERETDESSTGSADKVAGLPAADDDSPLGDTDQHSTA